MIIIKPTNAMSTGPSGQKHEETNQPRLVGPLYNVAGKLLVQLNKQDERGDNIVLSPFTFQIPFCSLLTDATFGSQTRREIQHAIGCANLSESDIEHLDKNNARLGVDLMRIFNRKCSIVQRSFEATKRAENLTQDQQPGNKLSESPLLNTSTSLVTKKRRTISSDKETGDFKRPTEEQECLNDDYDTSRMGMINLDLFWTDDFDEECTNASKIFYNHGANDKPARGKCLSVNSTKGARLLEFTSRCQDAQVKSLHERMSKNATFRRLARLNFRAALIPLADGFSFAAFEPMVDANRLTGTTIHQLHRLIADLFSPLDNDSPTTNLEGALELLDNPGNNNQLDNFRMPQFEIKNSIDLEPVLKSIGLKRAFDRERAEFSNLSGGKVYLYETKHQAKIEAVKSTINAPTDGIQRDPSSASQLGTDSISLKLERPFMFVVRYQKTPIFVGQLTHL